MEFPDLLWDRTNRSECRTRLAVAASRVATRWPPTSSEVSSSSELQQIDGVALQDQRPNFFADIDLLEIGKPALRRDQRVVRAEQYFSLELRVRVLNELRRKVLRRPARKV